mgnify:CR=1 FL=1
MSTKPKLASAPAAPQFDPSNPLIVQADRSILVAVMPHLRQEFGLSPTQLALINSVFFWVYAAGALLSGRLGDSVRRTRDLIGSPR